jgi:UDP-GlcNAc:undecaprenyl-phosphate GlcNAc-1-phosphate transferase
VFNVPPASVYLGDGGTYLIGAVMAALLAATWGPGVRLPVGVAGVALVAVPVLELCLAVLRRIRSRHSVFEGDRDHPYDQLVRRGWSKELAVVSYTVAGIVVVGVAVVAGRLLGTPLALAVAGSVVVLLALVGVAGFTNAPEGRRAGGGSR